MLLNGIIGIVYVNAIIYIKILDWNLVTFFSLQKYPADLQTDFVLQCMFVSNRKLRN